MASLLDAFINKIKTLPQQVAAIPQLFKAPPPPTITRITPPPAPVSSLRAPTALPTTIRPTYQQATQVAAKIPLPPAPPKPKITPVSTTPNRVLDLGTKGIIPSAQPKITPAPTALGNVARQTIQTVKNIIPTPIKQFAKGTLSTTPGTYQTGPAAAGEAFAFSPPGAMEHAGLGLFGLAMGGIKNVGKVAKTGAIVEKAISKIPQSEKIIQDAKYAFNINKNKLNITPEAKVELENTVNAIKPELEKNKGKVLTNQEVLDAAKHSDILTKVVSRDQTLKFNSALTALRQEVAAGASGKGISADFVKNVESLSSVAADTGRKLKAFDIGADATLRSVKEDLVKKLIDLGHKAEDIVAKGKNVNFDSPKEANAFYRSIEKAGIKDTLNEYRYINLLSSPKTHIVNAFSNLLQTTVVNPATKLVSGAIDTIGSKLTGKTQEHYLSQVPAYYKGALSSVGESVNNFVKVLQDSAYIKRPDLNQIPSGNRVLNFGPTIKGVKISGTLIPKLLEASDVLFQGILKGGEKEALATKYLKQGKKISAAVLDKQATENAAYSVFRKALDSSNKTGQGKVLSAIDKFTVGVYKLRETPGVGWIIPFVQTPMNILKQGIEYSPAGITTLLGSSDKTGQLAKALIGSGVMTGAAWVAHQGDSTWSVPTNPKMKEAFYAAGKQPYSIKIGDKWVSFSQLGPMAYPIAMAAAAKNYFEQDPKAHDKSTFDKAVSTLGGLTKFFSDQSYVQGLGDIVKAVQGDVQSISRTFSNLPSQVIPLSSLLRWVARTIDPVYRQPTNVLDTIKSQLPGVSTTVAPFKDVYGNPSKRSDPLINAFSPATISTSNQKGEDLLKQFSETARLKSLSLEKSKQQTARATQLYEELKKLNPDDANARLDQLQQTDPDLVGAVTKVAKKANLTPEEEDLSSRNIKNGDRARGIWDKLNQLKTPEEKNALIQDYLDKGIITNTVFEQLKKLRDNQDLTPPTESLVTPQKQSSLLDQFNPVKTAYAKEDVTPNTPPSVAPVIIDAAKKNGVPPKILAAIAEHESKGTFDPNLNQDPLPNSPALGKGMFQIDLGQHPDITEEQAKNIKFAADYAAKLLKDAYNQFGNWDDAIKAYNAGNPYSNAPGYNGLPISQIANQYLARIKAILGS